jgi:hypothetical protein
MSPCLGAAIATWFLIDVTVCERCGGAVKIIRPRNLSGVVVRITAGASEPVPWSRSSRSKRKLPRQPNCADFACRQAYRMAGQGLHKEH